MSEAKTTTIRKWAEVRDSEPARVKTAGGGTSRFNTFINRSEG